MKREYLTRIESRGFAISTLVPLALVVVIMAIVTIVVTPPRFLLGKEGEKPRRIAVIDLTGKLFPALMASLGDTLGVGVGNYKLSEVKASALAEERAELKQKVLRGDRDGYLLIPQDILSRGQAEFYTRGAGEFEGKERLQAIITRAVVNFRIRKEGINPQLFRQLTQKIRLKTFRLSAAGRSKEMGKDFVYLFSIPFIFLVIALMMYGEEVMRSVMEEKRSRVVEMIISAVRPIELMTGKILGVGMMGLTQLVIWSIFLAASFLYAKHLFGPVIWHQISPYLPTTSLVSFFLLLLYFLTGYFLYATFYAGLGAISGNDLEVNGLQLLPIFVLGIGTSAIFNIVGAPNSSYAVLLSFIPLFTPIIMFTRIAVQTPPLWQIGLSLVILGLAIWVMVWIVSKIYRVGILMYGKRPSLPELVKWFRYG